METGIQSSPSVGVSQGCNRLQYPEMTRDWARAIAGWRAWMKAADRPATTIKLRVWQLRRFAEEHPDPWGVTTDQLLEWLGGQNWATETRRSMRSALRGFYAWAVQSGLVEASPAATLPPIKPSQPMPRPAPEKVLADALSVADARQKLMLLLAARQGLRRAEIARVHPERDVTRDLAGWSLRVLGKGGKVRVIPLQEEIAALLLELPPGYAFPGQHDATGHISPYWVGRLVSRCLPGQWTTHTLRHRFATRAYAGSRDLLAVQGLLGHSRPETTQCYVQLPDDAMRAAMKHAA